MWACCGAAQALTWSCSWVFLPPAPAAVRAGGPPVGAAQALTWSCSRMFLPPAPAAVRAGGPPVGRSGAFHMLRGQSPPGDHVGLPCSLYRGWEGSGLLPPPHRPGFQLRLYFHLCMWVVHWGLLLRLPWRTRVCPCEGQVWRWCSCLGHRGSGSTRGSGELRLGQQAFQCSRRGWQPVLANTLQYFCLENHPL